MKNSHFRYLPDVVTLKLDEEKCTGCGLCAIVCPQRVFSLRSQRAEIIDRDACMECGACAKNCAAVAIQVEAGVGCASAIIKGWLTGTEPNCDCSGSGSC